MKSNTQPKRLVSGSYGAAKVVRRKQHLQLIEGGRSERESSKFPAYHRPKRKTERLCRDFLQGRMVERHPVDINIDLALSFERATQCDFRKEIIREFVKWAEGQVTETNRSVVVEVIAELSFKTNPKAGVFMRVMAGGKEYILPRQLLAQMRGFQKKPRPLAPKSAAPTRNWRRPRLVSAKKLRTG